MRFCFCWLYLYDYRNRGGLNMIKYFANELKPIPVSKRYNFMINYGYCLNDTGKPPKLWRIVECYEKHLLITDEQKTIIINTADFWQII